jgi:hypothetical protein
MSQAAHSGSSKIHPGASRDGSWEIYLPLFTVIFGLLLFILLLAL